MSPYQGSDESMRNKYSSGNESCTTDSSKARGRSVINSAKIKDFLDLGVENSRSNSCSRMIHLEYLPPNIWHDKIYCIGFASETTVVVQSRI
jgi:hypothetical protein